MKCLFWFYSVGNKAGKMSNTSNENDKQCEACGVYFNPNRTGRDHPRWKDLSIEEKGIGFCCCVIDYSDLTRKITWWCEDCGDDKEFQQETIHNYKLKWEMYAENSEKCVFTSTYCDGEELLSIEEKIKELNECEDWEEYIVEAVDTSNMDLDSVCGLIRKFKKEGGYCCYTNRGSDGRILIVAKTTKDMVTDFQ